LPGLALKKGNKIVGFASIRTWNGNHIGFFIRINDSKPRHVNVVTIDEAIEHGFAMWIKAQSTE